MADEFRIEDYLPETDPGIPADGVADPVQQPGGASSEFRLEDYLPPGSAGIDAGYKWSPPPGSTPENPLNERSKSVGILSRIRLKAGGTAQGVYKELVNELGVDRVQPTPGGEFNFAIRDEDGQWRKLDPSGLFSTDILADIPEFVLGEVPRIGGAAVGMTAGAPAGLPGLVAGGSVGGAAGETARQFIGQKLLGIPEAEGPGGLDPGALVTEGIVGGTGPILGKAIGGTARLAGKGVRKIPGVQAAESSVRSFIRRKTGSPYRFDPATGQAVKGEGILGKISQRHVQEEVVTESTGATRAWQDLKNKQVQLMHKAGVGTAQAEKLIEQGSAKEIRATLKKLKAEARPELTRPIQQVEDQIKVVRDLLNKEKKAAFRSKKATPDKVEQLIQRGRKLAGAKGAKAAAFEEVTKDEISDMMAEFPSPGWGIRAKMYDAFPEIAEVVRKVWGSEILPKTASGDWASSISMPVVRKRITTRMKRMPLEDAKKKLAQTVNELAALLQGKSEFRRILTPQAVSRLSNIIGQKQISRQDFKAVTQALQETIEKTPVPEAYSRLVKQMEALQDKKLELVANRTEVRSPAVGKIRDLEEALGKQEAKVSAKEARLAKAKLHREILDNMKEIDKARVKKAHFEQMENLVFGKEPKRLRMFPTIWAAATGASVGSHLAFGIPILSSMFSLIGLRMAAPVTRLMFRWVNKGLHRAAVLLKDAPDEVREILAPYLARLRAAKSKSDQMMAAAKLGAAIESSRAVHNWLMKLDEEGKLPELSEQEEKSIEEFNEAANKAGR